MTTPAVMFGIDAASMQHTVDWPTVDHSTGFGFEKVTEGTTYLNPFWAAAKTAMQARAKATGFIPGAYMFLHAGNAAAQAAWFAANAGDLSGFAIAVDVEPTGSSRPAMADAVIAVKTLRQLFPGHPIGGYIPHWYWENQDTTFTDWLWASRYVTATGAPRQIYPQVPDTWWLGYGGRKQVDLLQFTSTATVQGVTGNVDCSAFRGTPADYKKLVLPAPPPKYPVVHAAAHTWTPLPHSRWQIRSQDHDIVLEMKPQ